MFRDVLMSSKYILTTSNKKHRPPNITEHSSLCTFQLDNTFKNECEKKILMDLLWPSVQSKVQLQLSLFTTCITKETSMKTF